MKSVLVLTSISPRNVEQQLNSFTTWAPVATRLVSLNHRDEIETVSSQAKGISVAPIEQSAKDLLGKPFVYIDSFLEYFRNAPETHLIIVNSDIYLSEPGRMREIIEKSDVDLLFGQRVDVDSADSTTGDLFGGFDYFLLTKAGAAMYPKSKFCMGAPWWDHWMPMVPIALGRPCLLCSEPVVLHIKHSANWSIQPLSILGFHMAEQLTALWNAAGERLAKSGASPEAQAAFQFGNLFVKYFFERRKIYWHYHPQFEELPQPLKGEVSWDMTDVYPIVTLDFIMRFAKRF